MSFTITSASGRLLSLPEISPRDVSLSDIASATSKLCRFLGHCRRFYSVAEHLVLCCNIAERAHGHGSMPARCALLHDAHEAYISDVPSPIKHTLPEFVAFETLVENAVRAALQLPLPHYPVWAIVKTYDIYALMMEAGELFSPAPAWVTEVPAKFRHPIHCLTPDQARDRLVQKLVEYGYEI